MKMKKEFTTIKKWLMETEERELDISLDCYGMDGEGWEEMDSKEQEEIIEWEDKTEKILKEIIKIIQQ